MWKSREVEVGGGIWQLARRLYRYLLPYLSIFILSIVCMGFYSLFSLSRTTLVKFLIDHALVGEPSGYLAGYSRIEALYWICGGAALVAFLMSVCHFFQMYFREYINLRIVVDLQNDVFLHLLELPLSFFHRQKVGDLLSRLMLDIQAASVAVRYLFGEFILQPFLIITAVGFCLFYSWQMSLITFVVLPLVVVPLVRFGKSIRRRSRRRQVSVGEVTEQMQQMLGGLRVIKSFAMERRQGEEFREKNGIYFGKALRVARTKALAKSFIDFINNIGFPVIGLIGGYLIIEGGVSMSTGDLTGFLGATALMYPPIKQLSKGYNVLQESLASTSRVFEILEQRREVEVQVGGERDFQLRGVLAFEGVSFAYGEEMVLKRISFEARPGETVAIVGRSGAGKSTLLDLILRFYLPQEGRITLNGEDIRRFHLHYWRRQIAVVSQEPFLFHRTIAQNIAFGYPEATREEIEAAARAAYIHDFIMTLPRGYDTVVGERGDMLSGGQRQRITIARALLRPFGLLLLDEATSSLDSESEQQVQRALESLMRRGSHTTFVIAHRLSTVQGADKILVLDGGELRGMGVHGELLETCEEYRRLYYNQLG